MAPVTGSTLEAVEAAVRQLTGATGRASLTMQNVDGRELWTVHAHAVGAAMQGQGGSLSAALAKLSLVGGTRAAAA